MRNGAKHAGIAPGSFKTATRKLDVSNTGGPHGALTSVALDSVIFDNGEIVGPDTVGALNFANARLQAERDLHNQFLTAEHGNAAAQDAAWVHVNAVAAGSIDGISH